MSIGQSINPNHARWTAEPKKGPKFKADYLKKKAGERGERKVPNMAHSMLLKVLNVGQQLRVPACERTGSQ